MKIGFFGDSFCAAHYPWVNRGPGCKTYIQKLEHNYNAEIVHLGQGGASIYDVALVQLAPFLYSGKWPDVCIFVWTGQGRLFNRTIRNMTGANTIEYRGDDPIQNSAKAYYKYLYDQPYDQLTYNATLPYIDTTILTKIPQTTKIINLWSFGSTINGWDGDFVNNITYEHRFSTGMEIRPSMMTVSVKGLLSRESRDVKAPNHLDGDEKNERVFNWIKNAIDNYTPGGLINE